MFAYASVKVDWMTKVRYVEWKGGDTTNNIKSKAFTSDEDHHQVDFNLCIDDRESLLLKCAVRRKGIIIFNYKYLDRPINITSYRTRATKV